MSDITAKSKECLSPHTELKLLQFNHMGYKFAVDMDQVTRMTVPETLYDEKVQISCLHEKILFNEKVSYIEPRALIIKGEAGRAIMVDSPQEVFTVEITSIQPMPLLLVKPGHPMWGVIVRKGAFVFLIDCYRFLEYEEIINN